MFAAVELAQRPQQIYKSVRCKIAANVIVDVFGVCSATHSQIVSERQLPQKNLSEYAHLILPK